MNNIITKIYNNHLFQNTFLALLLFFTGLINSRRHIALLNIPFLEEIIIILFGVLLFINILIAILEYLFQKRSLNTINKYLLPLLIIILLKYLILFSQIIYIFIKYKLSSDGQLVNLMDDYPIYLHIKYMIKFIINFIMIFILTARINDFSKLNLSISAFGLGCVVAPILGVIFFPNLIGMRISHINGAFFSGSFWNVSVIAFVSSGWLLIGNLDNKKNILNKFIYLFMMMIMFFGGIAGISRAIIVSGFMSILIYIICVRDIKTVFKIIAILVIFILIIQLKFSIIIENYRGRLDENGSIKNEGRIEIWKDYLKNMKKFFILGEPIEGHKIFSKTGQGPHSILLNWWSQFGIFAVAAFIWLMWGIWKSASYIYKNLSIKQGAAVYSWIFAYLSLAMINETGYRELSFYAAMGIIFAWGNLARKRLVIQ